MHYLIRRFIFLPILFCLALSSLSVYAATANDYYNTGLSLYEKQKYLDAITYLKAAVSLDPNHWQALDVLALSENAVLNYVDALDHCEASLALHPDNPELQKLDQELKPKVYTPPLFPSQAVIAAKGRLEGPPLNPIFWIKADFLFDYSMEQDLNNAPNGWSQEASAMGGHQVNAAAGNSGFGGNAELGYQLDPDNAMSIDFSIFNVDGFQGHATQGVSQVSLSIQPSIAAFDLGYTHFFVHDYFRFFLNTSVGYTNGTFQVVETAPAPLDNITFQKGDFDVTLGGGYELKVDTNLGLVGSLVFRYLSISQVATDVTFANNQHVTYGLFDDPKGFIGPVPTSIVGQAGVRWAVFNLTGIQAKVGLIYYIF